MTTTITVSGEPVVAMTDDLEAVLRYAGRDPRDFNVMRWPVGAGRYGSIRVVVDASRIATLYSATFVEVDLGGLSFDLMQPLPAVPMVTAAGSVVYDVTLVDERYDWQSIAYDEVGLNVSVDDKSQVFASTGKDDGLGGTLPLTARDMVERLLCALETGGGVTASGVAFLESVGVGRLAYDGIRDVTVGGLPIGPVIDQVLASVGHVLVAYPNPTYHDPTDGASPDSSTGCFTPLGSPAYRYAVVPIGAGNAAVEEALTLDEDRLIAGGVLAVTEPPAGFRGKLYAPDGTLGASIPDRVVVRFPVATTDADYTRNDQAESEPGKSWQTDRYYEVESTAGRPAGAGASAATVVDTAWARFTAEGETPENATDLGIRADDVARCYYDRFRSGCGELLFAGLIDVIPWAGSQLIEWRANQRGLTTRITGNVDDPIFGWSSVQPLTPASVMSTGWVRAIPRPGGGILLDVPPEATLRRLYYATITAASAPVNALYDAVAIGFPGVSVEQKAPLRPWDVSLVDVEAAGVGEPCIIGERENGTLDLYVLQERPTLTTCESEPPAAAASDVQAFGAHGV